MKHVFYILALLFSTISLAQTTTSFEKGNTLYNQGEYKDAVEAYKAILDEGVHSAELYYNLGNAYYKLNEVAPSVYYYEKALQLAPNDNDIQNNLAFARNMTIDAIQAIPEAGFSKFLNGITNTMTFDGWAKTAVVFVCCFVVLFLGYYFAYATLWKRLAFIGSMASLVLMAITLSLAFHKFNLDNNDKPAIVFAKESKVRSEPNTRSEEAFTLHEGTKVQILENVTNWRKIKLADGKTGWIPDEDIKAL
jgi:tetratricopeptide (TPR) repeat protein